MVYLINYYYNQLQVNELFLFKLELKKKKIFLSGFNFFLLRFEFLLTINFFFFFFIIIENLLYCVDSDKKVFIFGSH